MESEREREEREEISLPQLYERCDKGKRRARLGVTLMATVALAMLVALVILLTAQTDNALLTPAAPSESEAEWRGAFARREYYEDAIACSVALRVGIGARELRWSGVIFDRDGWIATSDRVVDRVDNGRIYATLSDGREYPCEGVMRFGGMALLRISAEGLSAAERGDGELLPCESVVTIREGRDALSGRALGGDRPMRLDITYSEALCGAPVFGEDGRLAGIVGYNDGDVCAISIKEMEEIWSHLRK